MGDILRTDGPNSMLQPDQGGEAGVERIEEVLDFMKQVEQEAGQQDQGASTAEEEVEELVPVEDLFPQPPVEAVNEVIGAVRKEYEQKVGTESGGSAAGEARGVDMVTLNAEARVWYVPILAEKKQISRSEAEEMAKTADGEVLAEGRRAYWRYRMEDFAVPGQVEEVLGEFERSFELGGSLQGIEARVISQGVAIDTFESTMRASSASADAIRVSTAARCFPNLTRLEEQGTGVGREVKQVRVLRPEVAGMSNEELLQVFRDYAAAERRAVIEAGRQILLDDENPLPEAGMILLNRFVTDDIPDEVAVDIFLAAGQANRRLVGWEEEVTQRYPRYERPASGGDSYKVEDVRMKGRSRNFMVRVRQNPAFEKGLKLITKKMVE